MQIQAKDQLKYKGKDMLCDGNNKFDSGSVPHGNYGHLCSSINDIHRISFFHPISAVIIVYLHKIFSTLTLVEFSGYDLHVCDVDITAVCIYVKYNV